MNNDFSSPHSLPPPPRHVLGVDDVNIQLARGILVVVGAVWLSFAAYLVLIILWANYGTNTAGEIVGEQASRGRGTSYLVQFAYNTPDGPQNDEERLDVLDYLRLPPRVGKNASTVTVRYLKIGSFRYAGLVEFYDGSARAGLPVTMMLFLGVALISLFYQSWIAPAREKRLVQTGLAVSGKVSAKRSEKGKRSTPQYHYAHCTYKTADDQLREIEGKVPDLKRWESLAIGDVVTVLVDLKEPKHALIYDFCRYRVKGPPVSPR